MVVKIRFGSGSLVARGKKKNARLASLAASFLTLVAICVAVMGFWRLFGDLDLAGEFLFTDGILSHWQVWLGTAAGIQFGAWKLTQYYRGAAVEELAQELQDETLAEMETELPVNNQAALPL